MTSPLILAICREHLITPDEFFSNGRTRRLSAARAMAIELLRAKGLSLMVCARLIGRDKSTIAYWLHPEWRERKRASMRRYRTKPGKAWEARA